MIKLFNNFLFEMSNYGDDITGIKNIIIWIGPRPKTHDHRIKVSNDYYKMNKFNCFTITTRNNIITTKHFILYVELK